MTPSPVNDRSAEKAQHAREEILTEVESFIGEHGYSPTRAEIAALVCLSEYIVKKHVKTLISEGWLSEADGRRTLTISF